MHLALKLLMVLSVEGVLAEWPEGEYYWTACPSGVLYPGDRIGFKCLKKKIFDNPLEERVCRQNLGNDAIPCACAEMDYSNPYLQCGCPATSLTVDGIPYTFPRSESGTAYTITCQSGERGSTASVKCTFPMWQVTPCRQTERCVFGDWGECQVGTCQQWRAVISGPLDQCQPHAFQPCDAGFCTNRDCVGDYVTNGECAHPKCTAEATFQVLIPKLGEGKGCSIPGGTRKTVPCHSPCRWTWSGWSPCINCKQSNVFTKVQEACGAGKACSLRDGTTVQRPGVKCGDPKCQHFSTAKSLMSDAFIENMLDENGDLKDDPEARKKYLADPRNRDSAKDLWKDLEALKMFEKSAMMDVLTNMATEAGSFIPNKLVSSLYGVTMQLLVALRKDQPQDTLPALGNFLRSRGLQDVLAQDLEAIRRLEKQQGVDFEEQALEDDPPSAEGGGGEEEVVSDFGGRVTELDTSPEGVRYVHVPSVVTRSEDRPEREVKQARQIKIRGRRKKKKRSTPRPKPDKQYPPTPSDGVLEMDVCTLSSCGSAVDYDSAFGTMTDANLDYQPSSESYGSWSEIGGGGGGGDARRVGVLEARNETWEEVVLTISFADVVQNFSDAQWAAITAQRRLGRAVVVKVKVRNEPLTLPEDVVDMMQGGGASTAELDRLDEQFYYMAPLFAGATTVATFTLPPLGGPSTPNANDSSLSPTVTKSVDLPLLPTQTLSVSTPTSPPPSVPSPPTPPSVPSPPPPSVPSPPTPPSVPSPPPPPLVPLPPPPSVPSPPPPPSVPSPPPPSVPSPPTPPSVPSPPPSVPLPPPPSVPSPPPPSVPSPPPPPPLPATYVVQITWSAGNCTALPLIKDRLTAVLSKAFGEQVAVRLECGSVVAHVEAAVAPPHQQTISEAEKVVREEVAAEQLLSETLGAEMEVEYREKWCKPIPKALQVHSVPGKGCVATKCTQGYAGDHCQDISHAAYLSPSLWWCLLLGVSLSLSYL